MYISIKYKGPYHDHIVDYTPGHFPIPPAKNILLVSPVIRCSARCAITSKSNTQWIAYHSLTTMLTGSFFLLAIKFQLKDMNKYTKIKSCVQCSDDFNFKYFKNRSVKYLKNFLKATTIFKCC